VERLCSQILDRFEARAKDIAEEIAASTAAEVEGFQLINDTRLTAEIYSLARQHLDAFVQMVRDGGPPAPQALAAARERAALRAREMVPLTALVHSYLIAQRVSSAELVREAGTDVQSREAALALTAKTYDYNIAVTTAMADAYVEVVQGDLAEVQSARRGLVDTLLTTDASAWPMLVRRATGLGVDPDHHHVVAIILVAQAGDRDGAAGSPRWAAQAIARSSGKPERHAFVISRDYDLVALLDTSGTHPPRLVFERAAAAVKQSHGAQLRVGVGTAFPGLDGFQASYAEARRALRHTSSRRPFVFWPEDVQLFDELTTSGNDETTRLIPQATQRILADAAMRASIDAFFAADLNVATAAKSLSLHPNSLRYRLRRIAETTGRDPRKLADLMELVTAARLMSSPKRCLGP
jgi:hypothetical protein